MAMTLIFAKAGGGSRWRSRWRICSGLLGLLALTLIGCQIESSSDSLPLREVELHQSWELQPGDRVGGYPVAAGLGDISVQLQGETVYAPFDGDVQPHSETCVIFSTPDVPAYLFRLCGLENPTFGAVEQGEAIARGQYLHFATLRNQPEGTWALVESSTEMLERVLQPDPQE